MYKKIKEPITGENKSILFMPLNLFIPIDPANTDYQEYLKWISEGNEPLPADEPQLPIVESTPVVETPAPLVDEPGI